MTGVGDAMVEGPNGEEGSQMEDNEGSDLEKEEMNDPLERRGSTMNMKDPGGLDYEILYAKPELHFMREAPQTISHRH